MKALHLLSSFKDVRKEMSRRSKAQPSEPRAQLSPLPRSPSQAEVAAVCSKPSTTGGTGVLPGYAAPDAMPHPAATVGASGYSSQPGSSSSIMLVERSAIVSATDNLAEHRVLFSSQLMRAYSAEPIAMAGAGGMTGRAGTIPAAVVVQLCGSDWLSMASGTESATLWATAEALLPHRLDHPHLARLVGGSLEMRCLVYQRTPGATSLASRLCAADSLTCGTGEPEGSFRGSGDVSSFSSSSSSSSGSLSSMADSAPLGANTTTASRLKPFPWQNRLRVVAHVCRALTWLHQQSPPVFAGCLSIDSVLVGPKGAASKLLLAGLAGLGVYPDVILKRFHEASGFAEFPPVPLDDADSGFADEEEGYYRTAEDALIESRVSKDVFAFGLLILHLITGWVDRAAIQRLVGMCWAAEDMNSAVDMVVAVVREVAQLQPGCDWPERILRSLATLALDCTKDDEEARPEVVGCLETQVLEIERRATAL